MNFTLVGKSVQLPEFPVFFKYWRWAFAFYIIYFTAIGIPFYSEFLGEYAVIWTAFQFLGAALILVFDGPLLALGAFILFICNNAELLIRSEVISPEAPLLNALYAVIIFWKLSKDRRQVLIPQDLLFFLYCAIAVLHFTAGASKFFYNDPSWLNGSALRNILVTSPWVRTGPAALFVDWVPSPVIAVLSYMSILVELSGFLILFKKTRTAWIWIALSMHIGILFLLNLSQVSWGVILPLFLILIVHLQWKDAYEK